MYSKFTIVKRQAMKKTTLLVLLFTSLLIASCKKEESKKDYTLEMKVNGVLWKATKSQVGLLRRSDGYMSISGETATDVFGFTKNTGVTGVGSYQIPAGNFNFIYVKDGVQKIYGWTSTPKLVNINITKIIGPPVLNFENIEADFSAVAYDQFGTDSVVITDGKLRYQ